MSTADKPDALVMIEGSRASSPRESLLLKLPGELRNTIYRHALVKSKSIEPDTAEAKADLALLQVNQQIRREAIKIYYSENTFFFRYSNKIVGVLQKWAPSLGKQQARLIPSITFERDIEANWLDHWEPRANRIWNVRLLSGLWYNYTKEQISRGADLACCLLEAGIRSECIHLECQLATGSKRIALNICFDNFKTGYDRAVERLNG